MPAIQIGQLLVEQGVLTPRQVEHIIAVQRHSHRPFGDLAERLYGVSPQAVEDAWVEQYLRMAGVVDLAEQQVDADCLRLINRRQAWQFHLMPLNRGDDHINVATDGTDLVRAMNFCMRRMGDPVYFLIARRQQLREFLMHHYPVPSFIAQFADQF